MASPLDNLAAVVRSAGLATNEVSGWRTRGRSGGAPWGAGRPTHVMAHHTASTASADADVAYICRNAEYAPLANLYLARDGRVWVCAGLPTNTNGSGHDSWHGGVPDNAMNLYAIGIEAANNGTGEAWPKAQTDAYVTLVAALCTAYSIPVGHVRAHHEWAPGRKIDPAGPSPWAAGAHSWNMDGFRRSVVVALSPPSPPDPPNPPEPSHQETDMVVLKYGASKYRLITGDRIVGITAELATELTKAGIPGPVGVGDEDYENLSAALVAED